MHPIPFFKVRSMLSKKSYKNVYKLILFELIFSTWHPDYAVAPSRPRRSPKTAENGSTLNFCKMLCPGTCRWTIWNDIVNTYANAHTKLQVGSNFFSDGPSFVLIFPCYRGDGAELSNFLRCSPLKLSCNVFIHVGRHFQKHNGEKKLFSILSSITILVLKRRQK